MSGANAHDQAAVEVLFGSQCRGDHDHASDRDILIVDDRPSILKRRAEILSQQGWSVASYTFRKLQALAERGALFIQHLKMEGRILNDRHGRYSHILAGYNPKKYYTREIRENTRLAALLISQPQTEAGALWAADVLYVAVRNFGVLWLAERGRYTFSYRTIVADLVKAGVVAKEGESALLKLRFLKALYRSGERVPRPYAAEAVGTALMALPSRYFPYVSEAIHPWHIIRNCKPLPRAATAYSRLRNLEKAYVALSSLEESEPQSKDLATLSKWVKNPRVYAYMVVRNEQDILAGIAAALDKHPAPRSFWDSFVPIFWRRHGSANRAHG